MPVTLVMQRVRSSNVREIGYDAALGDLYVRFKTGTAYVYSGVPSPCWLALQQVVQTEGSIGTFVNTAIKPVYAFKKVYRLVSALEATVGEQVQVQDGGAVWPGAPLREADGLQELHPTTE
jgi:hypothetical protein